MFDLSAIKLNVKGFLVNIFKKAWTDFFVQAIAAELSSLVKWLWGYQSRYVWVVGVAVGGNPRSVIPCHVSRFCRPALVSCSDASIIDSARINACIESSPQVLRVHVSPAPST
jgi:hypothetical protein